MEYKDLAFELKNGEICTIRSPRVEDIEATLKYLELTASETEFILRYPEECGKYTFENEKRLFDRVANSPNEHMIIAVLDGEVIGCCNISWNDKIKTRHRANVAIAIIKAYWGQGLAKKLFAIMEELAMKDEYVLQMELEFVEGNEHAKALYEKCGFEVTGYRPNAIRLKDGTMLKEYEMVKYLKRG